MGHNILQAKQRQRQNFQQQENSEILYSVNYAAEFDTDVIVASTWVQNNGTGTVTPVVEIVTSSAITTSFIAAGLLRLIMTESTIQAGSYVNLSNLTGPNAQMIADFEVSRSLVVNSNPSFIEIDPRGYTDTFTGGLAEELAKAEEKTSSARIKGNVGTHRVTNQIITKSGNTMERQVVVNVLSNTDRLADDYFYYGRRGF